MSISLASFKDIMISKSGGKPLSKVSNFYSLVYQTMVKVKAQVDLPSSMRTVQLTNPVYTDIKIYPLPADMSLNGIVNLRPIIPNDTYFDFSNINQRQLKVQQKFSPSSQLYGVRNINGVQYLVINDVTTSQVVVNSCDSLTANGTTTALGVATSLALDGLQKGSHRNLGGCGQGRVSVDRRRGGLVAQELIDKFIVYGWPAR